MKKKAVITFLGNALYDSRVMNLYDSLTAKGIQVKVICYDFRGTGATTGNSDFIIYPFVKNNSIKFYVRFFISLIKNLAFTKYNYYFAEDVFTLPFVQYFSGLYGGKLIYDSRELYPFLAGLRRKTNNQKIIAAVERRYIYEADIVLVTGEMDKQFLEGYYNIKNILVLRNLPPKIEKISRLNLKSLIGADDNSIVLIYQGVLLEGRGLDLTIKAMANLPDYHFVILGDGEFKHKYFQLAKETGVDERVHFLGSVSQKELLNYTASADIGLALIENLSKSYYYALPNKLFEYIMAGIPVIVSDLPQMKKIVNEYNAGFVLEKWDEQALADLLGKIAKDKSKLKEPARNARDASMDLNWDKEFAGIERELLE